MGIITVPDRLGGAVSITRPSQAVKYRVSLAGPMRNFTAGYKDRYLTLLAEALVETFSLFT